MTLAVIWQTNVKEKERGKKGKEGRKKAGRKAKNKERETQRRMEEEQWEMVRKREGRKDERKKKEGKKTKRRYEKRWQKYVCSVCKERLHLLKDATRQGPVTKKKKTNKRKKIPKSMCVIKTA